MELMLIHPHLSNNEYCGMSVLLSGNAKRVQTGFWRVPKKRLSPFCSPHQRFRLTVISITFSCLPPLGIMYISYFRVLSSTILVTLRHTMGPLTGSS